MNKMRFANSFRFLALLQGLAFMAVLADEETPKPAPPYVAPVPANGEWIITAVLPKETAPVPLVGITKSVRFTKNGSNMRISVSTTDGGKTEYYKVENFVMSLASGGGVQVVQFELSGSPYPYFSKGFYGFDWITPESFVGVEPYQGRSCFHYRDRSSGEECWVDVSNQMPVATKSGGECFIFNFNPSSSPIEVPTEMRNALKRVREDAIKLEAVKVR